MVRTAVDRAFLPAKSLFEQVGDMMILTRRLLRPRLDPRVRPLRHRPVGVGTATAKSMVLNIVLVHIIGMLGTLVFWGANPRAPIGG